MSESWARAMLLAYDAHERTGKRQRVHGYRWDDGKWAYTVDRARKPPPTVEPLPPIVMTDALFAALSETLPRCAQRARGFHGGGSKLAITEERVARAMAVHVGQRAYVCDLPAPAVGPHWHLSASKGRWRR